MKARWLLTLLLTATLSAANFRLFMKDGEYHLVREYKVEGEIIKYYSVERGEWEELPTELVDLKKTEKERVDRIETEKKLAAESDVEEQAEREAAREVARVPLNVGVYYIDGAEMKPLKLAESKVVTNKRRSILQYVSPIPIVTGKSTLELDGTTSAFMVRNAEPEFYFRLSQPQRFGIVRLTPNKEGRIVENITVIPVSKEMVEENIPVEIFRRQVDEDLYKIWPMKPLEPGEYAVVEYTDGQVNMQVYDFTYSADGKVPPPPPPVKKEPKKKQ